jgi:hypothetical protein
MNWLGAKMGRSVTWMSRDDAAPLPSWGVFSVRARMCVAVAEVSRALPFAFREHGMRNFSTRREGDVSLKIQGKVFRRVFCNRVSVWTGQGDESRAF